MAGSWRAIGDWAAAAFAAVRVDARAVAQWFRQTDVVRIAEAIARTDERLKIVVFGLLCGLFVLGTAQAITFAVLARTRAEAARTSISAPTLPRVASLPVAKPVIDEAIGQLRIPHGVTAGVAADGSVAIRAVRTELVDAWIDSIGSLISARPEWRWSISKMCVGEGCDSALIIHLKANATQITP